MKNLFYFFLFSIVFSVNAQEANYKIKKTLINTKYQDFGVSYFGDSVIVFSSSRKNKFKNNKLWKGNKQPFLDLYKGIIDKEGNISNVQLFSKKINSKYHESNATFTKDLKTVYFTRNNYFIKKVVKDNEGWVLNQLYKAELGNEGEWLNIQPMPFNNDNYQTGHSVLNKAEDKLYFVSDMPGSLGLTDIYVVEIFKDGTYGEPKNLGPKINTSKSEMFPYIDDNDVLYYASDGFSDSKGGLDIYKVKLTEKSDQPVNLQAPINSKQDDFGFVKQKGKDVGYFSSNRKNGEGDDDIYAFEGLLKDCETDSCVTLDLRESEGLRKDNIIYSWDMGDGNTVYGDYITYCYANSGVYIAKLSTKDLTTGYIEKNIETIEIKIISNKGSYSQFTVKEKYELETPIKFKANSSVNGAGKIISYSWDLGDNSSLKNTSEFEYQYLRAGVYEVKLTVLVDNGHDGICEYIAIQSVLITKKEGKLIPPIIPIVEDAYKIDLNNKNLDLYKLKVIVTNRETEKPLPFSSIRIVDDKGLLWYSLKTNKFGILSVEIDRNMSYNITVSKKLYGKVEKDHSTQDRTEKEYSILSVELGLYISPIYFDYDKSNIRTNEITQKELDKVVSIMKEYPNILVELGSHTDSRGTDSYNMMLSQNRAKSAVEYIISRGISKERISGKGYGETQLVNACKNDVKCSEELHQLNRRTTFKILRF